jgi:hypothetical protein
MDSKKLVWLGMIVFGFIGGYIPVLFGAASFSMSTVFGNMIGGLVGIYAGFKVSQMF